LLRISSLTRKGKPHAPSANYNNSPVGRRTLVIPPEEAWRCSQGKQPRRAASPWGQGVQPQFRPSWKNSKQKKPASGGGPWGRDRYEREKELEAILCEIRPLLTKSQEATQKRWSLLRSEGKKNSLPIGGVHKMGLKTARAEECGADSDGRVVNGRESYPSGRRTLQQESALLSHDKLQLISQTTGCLILPNTVLDLKI